jgi:hypothetical protein
MKSKLYNMLMQLRKDGQICESPLNYKPVLLCSEIVSKPSASMNTIAKLLKQAVREKEQRVLRRVNQSLEPSVNH